MSENTDDFEIDLRELPTPSNEVEVDLDPFGEENGPREEIAPVDEPEEDEPEQSEANDVTAVVAAKLREELESKFGEWYVTHTCSGMRDRVERSLDSRATSLNMEDYVFEMVVPTEEVVEVRNNTCKTVTHCVLPSYVLVWMELTNDSWVTMCYTSSVTGFADHDQTPVPLSLDRVVSILTPSVVVKVVFETSIAVMRTKEKVRVVDFAVDDSVMVINGPLTRMHATITEVSVNRQRFRALVEVLGREAPVDLGFKQVEGVG